MTNVIKLKLPGTDTVHGVGKCGEHIVALHTTNIPNTIACGKMGEEGETRLGEHRTLEGAAYDAIGTMIFEMHEEDPELGIAILCALESAAAARATHTRWAVVEGEPF